MRRILLACFALTMALAIAPIHAQAPVQPLELVRSFYAPGFDNLAMPLSHRLEALAEAAMANSRKHDAPVTGLDFAWILNAQDAEPGFENTLAFAELKRGADEATIGVTFHNGRDEELHYELRQQNGKWVVDDIRYLRGEATTLSKMLQTGATETP